MKSNPSRLSFDWSSLIIFTGVVNALIAIVFLIANVGSIKARYSVWIIPLLLVVILILLERIIRYSNLENRFPELLFITSPLFFLIPPLLYAFQKRLVGKHRYWYLHFLIPLTALVYLLPTINMENTEKLRMYHMPDNTDPVWIVVAFIVYALFYIIRVVAVNQKFRIGLLNAYSSNDMELKLFSNRLLLLSGILLFAIPLSLTVQYLNAEGVWIDKLLYVIFSIIPHIFLFSILTFRELGEVAIDSEAVSDGRITGGELEDHKRLLSNFMSEKKPFLEKDLRLQDLADMLSWNRSDLSRVINSGFDMNFYDFVNGYRLEFALGKLKNGDYSKYSLDYIAAASGFKNYVSFYRVFKRQMKKSPRAYLKTLEAES